MATRVHLIEPVSAGRISGGYLYNQRVAAGAVELARHPVRLEALEADLADIDWAGPAWVIVDSLFLTPERLPALLALRRPGLRFGVLLHAFPSFIERATDRDMLARSLPLLPTADELALLDELDLLIAPGPYVPRLLAQCGARIPCVICPPGVDRTPTSGSNRRMPRAPNAPVRIISMGGVTPLKGLADGMQALASSNAENWEWTIVGHTGIAPDHVSELQALSRRLGLHTRVHFAGQSAHADTLALLRQSALMFLPSYTENAPLVALEALVAGVPVIGYAVGGLPDIVRDNETGLLAPLLDIVGLSQRASRLIRDPNIRQRLAQGCTHAAQALLSWEEAARHFVASLPDDSSLV